MPVRGRWVIVWAWLLVLGAVSHARLAVWQSDLALWRDAYEQAREKPRPALNYGRALEMSGDLQGAILQYTEVTALAADLRRVPLDRRFSLAAAESNIAHVYIKQGRLASAMRLLDQTLARWPSFPYAHYNRAMILWGVGACDDARQSLGIALTGDGTLSWPVGGPCARQ